MNEWREPFDAELAAEHRLEARPFVFALPLGLLVLQTLDLRLVREDGRDLRAEHDEREDAEEQRSEAEYDDEYERGGRRKTRALVPVGFDTLEHVTDDHEARVE